MQTVHVEWEDFITAGLYHEGDGGGIDWYRVSLEFKSNLELPKAISQRSGVFISFGQSLVDAEKLRDAINSARRFE